MRLLFLWLLPLSAFAAPLHDDSVDSEDRERFKKEKKTQNKATSDWLDKVLKNEHEENLKKAKERNAQQKRGKKNLQESWNEELYKLGSKKEWKNLWEQAKAEEDFEKAQYLLNSKDKWFTKLTNKWNKQMAQFRNEKEFDSAITRAKKQENWDKAHILKEGKKELESRKDKVLKNEPEGDLEKAKEWYDLSVIGYKRGGRLDYPEDQDLLQQWRADQKKFEEKQAKQKEELWERDLSWTTNEKEFKKLLKRTKKEGDFEKAQFLLNSWKDRLDKILELQKPWEEEMSRFETKEQWNEALEKALKESNSHKYNVLKEGKKKWKRMKKEISNLKTSPELDKAIQQARNEEDWHKSAILSAEKEKREQREEREIEKKMDGIGRVHLL